MKFIGVAAFAVTASLALTGPTGTTDPTPVATIAEHRTQVTYGQHVEAVKVNDKKLKNCLKKAKTSKQRKKCRARAQLVVAPVTPPSGTPGGQIAPVLNPAPGKGQPSAPGYTPVGNPASHSFLGRDGDQIAHWNYCTPIKYRVNPAGMNDRIRGEVDAALIKVSAASGLRFEYAGETDVLPFATGDWYAPLPLEESTLLIAAATADQMPILAGSTAGLGGSTWYSDGTREPRYFAGGLLIDAGQDITPGFVARGMGVLLLHEMGHVAGLGHVDDETQVMNPVLKPNGPVDYQAGDLAGFATLANFDCF